MAKSDGPITIKKYANRRLYNTGTSTYVTLEDLATMVKAGENFVVYDAKSSEDITRSVLAQIIFEQEKMRQQMAQAFGVNVPSFGPMEDHVRRNMEMFEKAFSMFTPFTRGGVPEKAEPEKPATSSDDIDALKRQIDEMQKRIDKISDKD